MVYNTCTSSVDQDQNTPTENMTILVLYVNRSTYSILYMCKQCRPRSECSYREYDRSKVIYAIDPKL
jgi:hypothetical protein